jgi:hypothetical protein
MPERCRQPNHRFTCSARHFLGLALWDGIGQSQRQQRPSFAPAFFFLAEEGAGGTQCFAPKRTQCVVRGV